MSGITIPSLGRLGPTGNIEPVPLNQSRIAEAFRNRPFQKTGAKFAAKHQKVCIADEPGLGKTIQSIAAIVQKGITGSVLVVAPKTAVYVTWPAELKQWLSDIAPLDRVLVIGGLQDKRDRLRTVHDILRWEWDTDFPETRRQWIIVSPNYLRFKYELDDTGRFVYADKSRTEKIVVPVREAIKSLLAIKWAAVIVDEAHLTLAGATGDIKKQSAQSRGLRMLQVKEHGMKLALTGTPFRGKHENLWGIGNWLYPEDYTSYRNWCNQHFFQYVDPVYGTYVLSDLRSEQALHEETKRWMIRRTKREVAPDLPPKMYGGTELFKGGPVAVWLPMAGAQRKAYDDMVDKAMAKIEGGTLMANGILAELIRLKQFSNSLGFLNDNGDFHPKLPSNKFDWILEFLAERGIDGKGPGESKVLIGSQFTRHILMFEKELDKLGIPTFTLVGQTAPKARTQLQQAFQTNSMETFGEDGPAPDVFLLNTKAGGTAITLDAADDVVIVDRTWIHDDQEQFEDRAHRVSRIHNVTIWNLVSSDTIDESIMRTMHKMNMSMKQILDGERGVEFAMKLLSEPDKAAS